MATHEIKCARCKVALKGPPNPKAQDRIECPRCGVGDSFKRVMDEVKEQAAEQMSDALGRTLEAALRGSKNMKLTKTSRARKPHRLIVDFKL